jgi:hypothetical protein
MLLNEVVVKKDAPPHTARNRPNIVKSIALMVIFFKKFTEDSYKLSWRLSSALSATWLHIFNWKYAWCYVI